MEMAILTLKKLMNDLARRSALVCTCKTELTTDFSTTNIKQSFNMKLYWHH